MKKLFTLLALSSLASTGFGQITINSTDMPVPTSAYNYVDFTSTSAANPTVGTSATWDYSTYTGTTLTSTYLAETDTFFTHAGVDVYFNGFKSLISGLGYNYFGEVDFNSTAIAEAGIRVQAQGYDLSSMTHVTGDSLLIPAQKSLLSAPKELIHFPATSGSNWGSVTRRSLDFFLTVSALSYSHTPAQHVYYIHRTDSVKGWGKMRVYASGYPSIQYDVLMDKIAQWATDSFYISGSPASSTVLSLFGATQGQVTDTVYRYNFYRKTTFSYLLSFSFGHDATYTTPVGKYMHQDGIVRDYTGVKDVNGVSYSTVVFPNPSVGSEINMLVSGREVEGGKYTITDIAGRTIQSGNVEMKGGAVHVSFNDALAKGNYFFTVIGADGAKVASEQFSVSK